MPKIKDKIIPTPTSVWQEWAKKRAQNAPSRKCVYEISKKVKINVTQLLLEVWICEWYPSIVPWSRLDLKS